MDLKPFQWALLAVLLLLAMAGIYYAYLLLRGYRCLPLKTAACKGGKPHYLVYVTRPEMDALSVIAKHKGAPPPLCHGIPSYPKRKHWRERQAAEDGEDAGDNHGVCNDNPESEIRCETGCDGKNDAIMMSEIDEGGGACWGKKCMADTTIATEQGRQLTQLRNELRWDDRARDPETGMLDEWRLDEIYEDMLANGRPLTNPFTRVPTRYNDVVEEPGCRRAWADWGQNHPEAGSKISWSWDLSHHYRRRI